MNTKKINTKPLHATSPSINTSEAWLTKASHLSSTQINHHSIHHTCTDRYTIHHHTISCIVHSYTTHIFAYTHMSIQLMTLGLWAKLGLIIIIKVHDVIYEPIIDYYFCSGFILKSDANIFIFLYILELIFFAVVSYIACWTIELYLF